MVERVQSSLHTVRTAEVVASMSLATDLGMGLPFEQRLRSTLTTMRLCEVLDVNAGTAAEAHYA